MSKMSSNSDKPVVCWITADCFVDCDLKPGFLKVISEVFSIRWIVVLPKSNARYSDSDFEEIKSAGADIEISFLYMNHRLRDIRRFLDYKRLKNSIKKISPDVIYLNLAVGEPFMIPLVYSLPTDITVITAHQGRVHEGMKPKWLYSLCRNLVYRRLTKVNMFSKSQMIFFKDCFPKSRVFLNQLGLKEFGTPTVCRDRNSPVVRFLSFGIINHAKNIELLIDAAESLYDEGERGFTVSINGGCDNWAYYAQRIKYAGIFELDIRMIPNEAIPDLFTRSHFFVQPYRVVSQSGPLKIAYSYNTPVIVSDLPGFTDEVVDGVSGFIFKSEDMASLKTAMKRAIKCYQYDYSTLEVSMADYVRQNYSSESMAKSYLHMFQCVLNNEQ